MLYVSQNTRHGGSQEGAEGKGARKNPIAGCEARRRPQAVAIGLLFLPFQIPQDGASETRYASKLKRSTRARGDDGPQTVWVMVRAYLRDSAECPLRAMSTKPMAVIVWHVLHVTNTALDQNMARISE